MRIPNLTHGSMFMLGAYFGVTCIALGFGFWPSALVAALGVALFGAVIERFVLRRLVGAELAQVLVTLGPVVHGRRCLPDAVGRRSDLGGDAARPARRDTAVRAWRFPPTGWPSS